MDQREELEARAYLIARELIVEHGDGVAQFLEDRIRGAMDARDYEAFLAWGIVRNAVARSSVGDLQ